MRVLASLLLALTAPLSAQINPGGVAIDVGLTMQNGSGTTPTAIVGQRCGPFTCTPFGSPSVGTTASPLRLVRVYGAPASLYVLAISTGPALTPCVTIPGWGNALILSPPFVVLAFGLTGPLLPSTSLACNQGVATYQLVLPSVAPALIEFQLQALADSFATQAPALTIAVRGWAQ